MTRETLQRQIIVFVANRSHTEKQVDTNLTNDIGQTIDNCTGTLSCIVVQGAKDAFLFSIINQSAYSNFDCVMISQSESDKRYDQPIRI